MAAINDLIAQIENSELRARIQAEFDRMNKQKKFGLVFEEHLPECTPLYDIPVKKGALVALKTGKVSEVYRVLNIKGDEAECKKKDVDEFTTFNVDELVTVAEFGEPIYPYLKPIDTVCNAPDSDLWHTLIEADNYHALQLLEYLYAGKVDCIYIDPPYNTGARDWKYNNDYVDNNDRYRHSKWLSMMQKRLRIAKKLLNPADSVLIVTIDEKEYLHLGCLLEEMFSNCEIEMITSVINPKGTSRVGGFQRVCEYIYVIRCGKSEAITFGHRMLDDEKGSFKARHENVRWQFLKRGAANHGKRKEAGNLFYPIIFDVNHNFIGLGDSYFGDVSDVNVPNGKIYVFPIGKDGIELSWNLGQARFMEEYKKGYIDIDNWKDNEPSIKYLTIGQIRSIENGELKIVGHKSNGAVILQYGDLDTSIRPVNVWCKTPHDAGTYGSSLLNGIFIDRRFSFPKSLYAVHDAIRFFVANKPNALIVDFFAGSGTTLHAVNLLNSEDGGHRRCIMVTNNEVSEAEAKDLKAKGFKPGDSEWEALGIAHYVTWPRTVCSIKGENIKGEPLKGNYIGSDIPMADGFKANAAFFKLGFLDKNAVALGRQFKEMLPTLWMKAGAIGRCPTVSEDIPDMLILSENKFAVLIDEMSYMAFEKQIAEHPEIETIYIVTDSEPGYREMVAAFDNKNTYQLYRDYLDNFRINTGR